MKIISISQKKLKRNFFPKSFYAKVNVSKYSPIYTTTLYQPAYEHLKEYYGNMEEMIKYQTGQALKIAHFLDPDEELVNPESLDKNKTHIMIFDDVLHKDQKQIKDYFCRGRHNNVNVFYLVQSLHAIAKHCIRQNANIFILFHQ